MGAAREAISLAVDEIDVVHAGRVSMPGGVHVLALVAMTRFKEKAMRTRIMGLASVVLAAAVGVSVMQNASAAEKVAPALDFTMKTIDGKDRNLADYQGRVVLIVNVASKCGLTPQYEALETVHKKYDEKGLSVLGFPANEFGKQEPGTDEEIATFCKDSYGVDFDMFSKIVVKGEGQHPFYKFLTSKETNPKFPGDIRWNFEKFLVGRNGEIVARFAPPVKPDSEEVIAAIEAELAKPAN
jgi:glutathione peroxidase